MGSHEQRNQNPNPGDSLRDIASDHLSTVYGDVKTEERAYSKKVDAYFEKIDFGSKVRIYIECKDEARNLSRSKVNNIWGDYEGILSRNEPASLLLVTRVGLSADAQGYIKEKSNMRHQTIWEIENHTLDLVNYQKRLASLFEEDELANYYIPAKALTVQYEREKQERVIEKDPVDIFEHIKLWVDKTSVTKPIAILAGYGAGKTSFAKRVVSHFSAAALKDPSARRVIYIKLGDLARSASLENLLGGMFTSTHKISNFDFDRFTSFNERGRFLIVLDGFDEMKHAMSWNDFQFNASELNKLVTDKSKILLLGRPSAFMSEQEHLHVLRGVKKTDEYIKKLPNWPEYQEFEICEFTSNERKGFIEQYTPIAFSQVVDGELSPEEIESQILERVEQLVSLADSEPKVFSKPVHLKILTEIAVDPNVNLAELQANFSKWKLYKLFIDSLIDRELAKVSRKDLSKADRQEFLRELCEWLWIEKNAQTNFGLAGLPFSYEEDELRELLIGSILEKKSGNNYYFSHRSFPEFILAEKIVREFDQQSSHSKNSKMFTDGVQSFLEDGLSDLDYERAFYSLSEATGNLSVQYLSFLIENNRSSERPSKLIEDSSTLKPLVSFLEIRKTLEEPVLKEINSLFSNCCFSEKQLVMLIYTLTTIPPKSLDTGSYSLSVLAIILGNLIKIVFLAAGNQDAKRGFTIEGEFEESALSILKKLVIKRRQIRGERHLDVDVTALMNHSYKLLENCGLTFDGVATEVINKFVKIKTIPQQALFPYLQNTKSNLITHLQYNSNFSSIAVKATKKNRIPRRR